MRVMPKGAINCFTFLLFILGLCINISIYWYTINQVILKIQSDNAINAECGSHEVNKNKSARKSPESAAVKNPNDVLQLCPENPPNLVGMMAVNQNSKKEELGGPEELNAVRYGGQYKPRDCNARERTAVIVPYRDRAEHLDIFLHHMHTVLQRQQLEYGIYVVEMAYPTQFNKGLLANVGYLTAKSVKNYTCYVIHDVDLLPSNDENLYRCYDSPCHMATANSKYNYTLFYETYFGGAVSFRQKDFEKVNGFSNLYFGWGCEDDDLQRRVLAAGLSLSRRHPDKARYEALEHNSDAGNPRNPNRVKLLRSAASRMSKDGLNSIEYTRLGLEFRPLYTWIYVKVDEVEIMKKFQYLIKPRKEMVITRARRLGNNFPVNRPQKGPGAPAITSTEKKLSEAEGIEYQLFEKRV